MITENTMNQICEKRINNELITTKMLTSFGLSQYDIKKLITDGILRRTKIGEYELVSAEEMYQYGLSLLKNKEYQRANLCFRICTEINPYHRKALQRQFYVSVKRKNYDEAYKLLDNLCYTSDEEEIIENNVYRYLLNYSVPCPDEDTKNKLKSLATSDLLSQKENNQDINEVIEAVVRKKPATAIKKINLLTDVRKQVQIHTVIIREFLLQALQNDREMVQKLHVLCQNEKYFDMQTLLSEKRKTRNYKTVDAICMELVRKIIYMINNNAIEEIDKEEIKSTYSAIIQNEFAQAKKLNDEYNQRFNMPGNPVIELLLTKAIDLATNIKAQETELEKTSIIKQDDGNFAANYELSSSKVGKQEEYFEINLSQLILLLLQNDIEGFSKLVTAYLKNNNKQEYELLINKLLQICIIENDKTFITPIRVLTELTNGEYQFDVTSYIQTFYLYVSQLKIKEAQLILEIISYYYQNSDIIIENLNTALRKSEEALTKQEKQQNFDVELKAIKPTIDPEIIEAKELITRKLYEMKTKEEFVGLIKDVPYNQRCNIYAATKDVEGLSIFSIGKEPKTIVLRITKKNNEQIIYKEVIDEFYLANSQKKYGRCLEIIKALFQDDKFNPLEQENPKVLFDVIAHIYLMLNNHQEAIKYLTITTEMNRADANYNSKYNYRRLIETLTNLRQKSNGTQIDEEQEPLTVKRFGLEKLEKIVYDMDEGIISLNEAIDKFQLTNEDLLLIKLIRARNFYIDRMPELGDKLIKEVEGVKNKSITVLFLLDEINANKKLYSNRFEGRTRKRSRY